MLSYSFDDRNGRPLYEHLYNCIKEDILSGALPSQTKLPSKRSFATNLGVSTITVENAYAQLVSEGYIFSIPKKGYYVSDLSMEIALSRGDGMSTGPSPEDEDLPSGSKASLSEGSLPDDTTEPGTAALSTGEEAVPPYFADFSSNQTRPENFPFSVWAKLMREMLSEQNDILMTRSPAGGILKLRASIASHLKQFRGMDVKPEQIIIGAGTEYLYGLLIQLLGFDKSYAVENPGYEKVSLIYARLGVTRHFIDMDRQGIRIDQLEESGADVVHISPSHHFPTGIITRVTRRYELLCWASGSGSRYIIEDDYDSEFRLAGKPIPALASIDKAGKVIYMNTFSKTLSSTLRISYMVLPKRLLTRFQEEMGFYSCTVSNFEQYSLMRFISEGYFEKHINRMRNYYHKQRDRLLAAIKKSPLSSLVTITEEDAGLHFLMKIDTAVPDHVITKRALRQNIRLTSLTRYYQNPPADAEHTFIINYSFVEPERIEEAVARIYSCLE